MELNIYGIQFQTETAVSFFGSSNSEIFKINDNGIIAMTVSVIGGTMGYTDNAEAISNGLFPGDIYHTQGILKVVV